MARAQAARERARQLALETEEARHHEAAKEAERLAAEEAKGQERAPVETERQQTEAEKEAEAAEVEADVARACDIPQKRRTTGREIEAKFLFTVTALVVLTFTPFRSKGSTLW